MPEPIRIPDTPAPFREWLESLPGAQVVGQARTPYGCFLVSYLRHLGAESPEVWAQEYSLDGDSAYEDTPWWAENLLNAADHDDEQRDITATQCLAILEAANA